MKHIKVVKNSGKANYPFIVECQNTENWNSYSGHQEMSKALSVAKDIKARYPALRVRIVQYTGGVLP